MSNTNLIMRNLNWTTKYKPDSTDIAEMIAHDNPLYFRIVHTLKNRKRNGASRGHIYQLYINCRGHAAGSEHNLFAYQHSGTWKLVGISNEFDINYLRHSQIARLNRRLDDESLPEDFALYTEALLIALTRKNNPVILDRFEVPVSITT